MKGRQGHRVRERHRRSGSKESRPDPASQPRARTFAPNAAAALVLLLIVACLFHLRRMPAAGHDVDLQMDAAFNYRMTYDLLKTGTVPAIDPLSTYPEGKAVTTLLPTGIYYACAAFRRGMDLVTSLPLTTIVFLFCSLCGSLIAVPVYFISLTLYRSRPIALVSAALAGMIPGFMERTLCYWYRDEILAVPVLFTSLLFFLRMFDSREGQSSGDPSSGDGSSADRSAVLNGSIAMALLVAAFFVWRLCVLFVVAYAVSLVYLAFRSAKNRRRVVIAGLLLLCFCGVLLVFIPGFGLRNPESHYGSFPRAFLEIGLNHLGLRTEPSDFTRLVSDNRELRSIGPVALIGWQMLSLSAVFPLVFLLLRFGWKVPWTRPIERSAQRDVVCVCMVLFGALTVLVCRNVVFFAPCVAITAGESLGIVRDRRLGRTVRYAMLAVVLVLLAKTGVDGYLMASRRHADTRIGKYLAQALEKIRDTTPPGAVVSCYWAEGYMVQSYCNRPTLTDGLFESREIVSRIVEESRAYYSEDEGALWNYCAGHGAGYLLVPVYRTESYAHQAGVDDAAYFTAAGPTAAGKATVLYRLLHEPDSLEHFHELFHTPTYVLFQVLGADSRPQGAASESQTPAGRATRTDPAMPRLSVWGGP